MLHPKITLVIFFTLLCTTIQAQKHKQSEEEEQEQFNQLVLAVENDSVQFEANMAYTQRGRSINLATNPNNLLMVRTYAKAFLPYFGVSRMAGYGTSSGIEFEGELEKLKVKSNIKKQKVEVSFEIRGKSEVYQCNLILFVGESASCTINSSNRDRINYSGRYRIKK